MLRDKKSMTDHNSCAVQQDATDLVGTGVFASLNVVHVKYRGFFVERFVCCSTPLREVCNSLILSQLISAILHI